MIYTITLNPAIDVTIETNGFSINETNYYTNSYSFIGGKGINVAFILNQLEAEVYATGFLGKDNSDFFVNKFKEFNINNNFIIIDGLTRTNFKIKNLSRKEETELNGLGFIVNKNNINEIILQLSNKLLKGDILIAAGSLPRNTDTSIYQRIGDLCLQKEVVFILDTSHIQMIKALKAKPYLIKPNIQEICEILGKKFENREYSLNEVKLLVEDLKKLGARNILLSMGAKGSIFFTEDNKIYKTGIAKGDLINSVGSGDSMVAGFAYGLYKGMSIKERLMYASACGGATAFSEWLAYKKDIIKYLNTIEIKEAE
ncbi:1-phosphofructokinase [Spiroplasma endosymbiont of Aspidapion aeneum]|uniref:1-phosphofructokinase n=1 Tax=Spiroplasma endosymbiont of Aspidapion aeneum TaxID=3066276 RepID=UPI00313E6235